MLCEINQNETNDALREVPVYLEKTGGGGYTDSLAGFTITFRKPGGAHADATSKLTSLGNGEYKLALDAGDVDTEGNAWVRVVGGSAEIVEFDDFVRIKTDSNAILGRLPAALDSGFIAARIDSSQLADIAGAVWDLANMAAHRVAGSFGDLVQYIAGQLGDHSFIDNIGYGANNVVTAARRRIFKQKTGTGGIDNAVAAHADDADGEIFRTAIVGVDAGGGQISSLKETRVK